MAFIISGCSNLVGAILMLILSVCTYRRGISSLPQASLSDIDNNAENNSESLIVKSDLENCSLKVEQHLNTINRPIVVKETNV